jgi:hypothetical protein
MQCVKARQIKPKQLKSLGIIETPRDLPHALRYNLETRRQRHPKAGMHR